MTLCPICAMPPNTFDGTRYCCECGNVWEREAEPITRTFPYPLGTVLYSPDKFNGKLVSIDRYEIIGYHFDERGTWARMKPLSYDGVWTDWRVPFENLYLSETEARGTATDATDKLIAVTAERDALKKQFKIGDMPCRTR